MAHWAMATTFARCRVPAPLKPSLGFATEADAEAERAKHRPGRRRKIEAASGSLFARDCPTSSLAARTLKRPCVEVLVSVMRLYVA